MFFIHSVVDKHSGCVHVLASVKNAAEHTGVRRSLPDSDSRPLVLRPEVELLDHVVVLFPIGPANSILFSTVAAPTYNPTSSGRALPLLHTLGNTRRFWLFESSHPGRPEVTAHCDSDSCFPDEHVFRSLLAVVMASLEKSLFKTLSHF